MAQPQACPANLTLVIGVGALAARTVEELSKLLASAPVGQRLAMATWVADTSEDLEPAVKWLWSAANLDALENLGFQIPERVVRQPLRLLSLCVVDLSDARAEAGVERARKSLEALQFQTEGLGLLLGTSGWDDIISHTLAKHPQWNLILPFPQQDAVAGSRSAEDISASVARLILLIANPDRCGIGSALRRLVTAGSESAPVACLGGAFVDSGERQLFDYLEQHIAARLLRLQYENLKPFEPAAAFDDQRRGRLIALLGPEDLARKLLKDTPFRLGGDNPWSVSLVDDIVTAELAGVPRRRWIAVLLKLRDFFDFTKARRWREAIEDCEEKLKNELEEAAREDIAALHRYVRGPDRLAVWAERVRDALEKPVEIASVASADLESAVENLRQEISRMPGASLWSRVALLGLLGAEAVRRLLQVWPGALIGWIGFATALAVATLLGLRLFDRAHLRLVTARENAQRALANRYEAQTRDNLILSLGHLRSSLLARIISESKEVVRQSEAALKRAEDLERATLTSLPNLIHVEPVIDNQFAPKVLEHLNPAWAKLQAEAADLGALSPVRGEAEMVGTAKAARDYARSYLESRRGDLTLERLLLLRGAHEPGYADRICARLYQRASMLAGGALISTWAGPADTLDLLSDEILAADANAVKLYTDMQLLGCVMLRSVPGGGK